MIALRHEGEHPDIAMRFEPSLAIARDAGAGHRRGVGGGIDSRSRGFLSLVAMGDLASTYHAIGRGVDPTPIDAIMRLKAVPRRQGGFVTVFAPADDLAAQGAAVVRAVTDLVPRAGIVLGSGLGPALGEDLEEVAELRLHRPARVPTARRSRATRASSCSGRIAGVPVAVFFGRVHFYEGHGMVPRR